MKRMKFYKWKDEIKYFEKGVEKTKYVDASTEKVVKNVMMSGFAEKKTNGWDQTRMANRIGKALEKGMKNYDDAKGYGTFTLEDGDYGKVRDFIDAYSPPSWGFNDDIMKALNAIKEEAEDFKIKGVKELPEEPEEEDCKCPR